MGIGYTRQSSADIVDGLPITAAPLNNEFNAIRDAFDQTNGHSHDGTVGEGPKIDLGVSTTGVLPESQGGTGQTSTANLPISTATQQALNSKANIDSPTLTGTPAAPTAANSTNTTQIATTAHIKNVLSNGATLGSTWTVPTFVVGTNSTAPASTAYVLNNKALGTDLRALTEDVKYTTSKTHADAMLFNTITGSTSTITPDLAIAFNIDYTLAGNVTFAAATNPKAGLSGTLIIRQDGTGSRTASWNAFWDFGIAGVPTLTTGANTVNYVFYQIVPTTSGGTNLKAICTFRGL